VECIVSRVVGGDVSVVGSKLISLNYNLCYECLSIIFDCKRRLLWLLVATWLATSRQLVAIVWQLVANQSSDAYLNMKTGIFLQIQDLAVPASLVSSLTTICKQGRLRLCRAFQGR